MSPLLGSCLAPRQLPRDNQRLAPSAIESGVYNSGITSGVFLIMSRTDGSNGNGAGAPKPRAEWITKRREEVARTGDTNMSQMHFARKGMLTEEMLFVAEREQLAPEVIRDDVA